MHTSNNEGQVLILLGSVAKVYYYLTLIHTRIYCRRDSDDDQRRHYRFVIVNNIMLDVCNDNYTGENENNDVNDILSI
jgi:hypothetical protein